MRKTIFALLAIVGLILGFSATAHAQTDTVIGTVIADPATVPEAGEYVLRASGSDFIPDTSILLIKCVSPADTLVPGVADIDEITEAAMAINALTDCAVADAQNVEVDEDGNWTAELTADVADNFFLSAGALNGSQAGATWVAIVPDEAEAAAEEAAQALAQARREAETAAERAAQAVAERAAEAAAEDEAEAAAEAEAEAEAAAEDEAEAAAQAAAEAEAEAAAQADEDEPEALADTGVETGVLAVLGAAVLGAGVLIAREGRRFRP